MEETSYNEPTAKLVETTASRGRVIYATIGLGIVFIMLMVALTILCASREEGGFAESTPKYVGWIAIGILFLIGIPVLLFLILGAQNNVHIRRSWDSIKGIFMPSQFAYLEERENDINDILMIIGCVLLAFGILTIVGVIINSFICGETSTTNYVTIGIVIVGLILIGFIMYTTNPTLVKGFISGLFHKNAKKALKDEPGSASTAISVT
ncbi:putative integral membrane protein [Babesia bovis T2Bo]|uniref:putative integral membrane protein n=1 Tax=Babesia bovis T2Bo TaxID=484906 RepID=UPI001C354E7B|nr:putative integral membrane protein [Babesia bovis T2Bo]KAG6440122.1 putative integral membrane protein [Babesia bovis T2Bo]